MTLFILRRLIQSVVVLLAVSLTVFLAVYAVGDPIELLVDPRASLAERQIAIERLGLNRPLWIQYLDMLQGNLGVSYRHGVPPISLIMQRLPATLELVIIAIGMALIIGIPLGLAAGLRPETRTSRCIMSGSIVGFSLPSFWTGMLLILVFASLLHWLPVGNRGETISANGIHFSIFTLDGWKHLILPAVNLGIANIALVIRLTASGTAEARLQDYVKYARAKGIRPSRIVRRHILRNIMIPVVTVMGLEFGSLLAYSTVTEKVFNWPGMGKLLLDSLLDLDRPVVVAYVLLVTFFFVIINLLVDILYAFLDPRVQLEERSA